jgi:hypothetical protein
MSGHEVALQTALITHLRADPALQALLGTPARVWDEPPEDPASPHLLIGRGESRPVAADGCGVEHAISLSVVSAFRGLEEVRAVTAAVRARLRDATLVADGVRTVSLGVTFADVFRAADFRRAYAVIRVRAVTEEV